MKWTLFRISVVLWLATFWALILEGIFNDLRYLIGGIGFLGFSILVLISLVERGKAKAEK